MTDAWCVDRRKGGGPRSRDGKERSSQNSIKHGGRSKIVRILPGEDPEDYERVKNGWLAEYEPEGHMEITLVSNLIESEWLLLRARRNRLNAEARAAGEEGKEPHEWTPEDAHQVELMQRYLTTAERSFYRAFNAIQGLRKDILRNEREACKLQAEQESLKARLRQLQGDQPPAQMQKLQIERGEIEQDCAVRKTRRSYARQEDA